MRRHGNARTFAKPCTFSILERVGVEDVLSVYADLYVSGHHEGERPTHQLELLRAHGDDWVLAVIPIAALDYQTIEESSEPRQARARAYARRPGSFPPGIALYSGRSQKRRTGRGYVMDGNHRVMAATMRGDCSIRMFMPAVEYTQLLADASHRGVAITGVGRHIVSRPVA